MYSVAPFAKCRIMSCCSCVYDTCPCMLSSSKLRAHCKRCFHAAWKHGLMLVELFSFFIEFCGSGFLKVIWYPVYIWISLFVSGCTGRHQPQLDLIINCKDWLHVFYAWKNTFLITQETRLNSSQCINDVNTQCVKIRKVILLLSCIRIGRYKNDPKCF